jgi:hypothetical protein
MFTLKGTLKTIKPKQQVTDKFAKREFVLIDNNSQYPQHILFQTTQERCALLDNYQTGDEIEVGFYIRGRETNNPQTGELRYFNSLDVFKINKINNASYPKDNVSEPHTYQSDADDLPF